MRASIFSSLLALLIPVLCAATPGAQFPKANGLKFEIDGKTQYFAGTNSYWLPFLTDNGDIDLTLDHLAGAGLKIIRTWGFNDVTKIPSKGEYFTRHHKHIIEHSQANHTFNLSRKANQLLSSTLARKA